MSDVDEVVKEFLVESYENLDRLDRELVALESDPSSRDTLASIFRTIHTIKGTCGFLGFGKLESVAHVGENLLSKLRDGQLTLDSAMTSALLALVDAVRQMLTNIEQAGNDGQNEFRDLIVILTKLQENRTVPAAPAPPAAKPEPAPAANIMNAPAANVMNAPAANVMNAPAANTTNTPAAPAPAPALSSPAPALPKPEPAVEAAAPAAAAADSHGAADSTIRVDVGLLDKLMNLVGELVLARNQILQFSSNQKDASFNGTTQRLNLITTELQEGVMKTRMQPIGNVWSKFPRVVRDLAVAVGKKVRIEMEGKETDLDKTIIEAIKDPLTHIVRNSVDHGIEMPAARAQRGKPEEGCLRLRAYHEGGQVNIEISDDGGGIDPEKIKNKAVSRGVLSTEQAARMSDREAINLIFLPGFSTAEKVSNISGRGVGMDVVKTNIEKIGGTVDIQSRVNEGTIIKIKIPLTLAIIPGLVVTCGTDQFVIPQVSLLELVRLEAVQAKTAIEMIDQTPVYRLRGNLLPLVYLSKELNIEVPASDGADHPVNIVVLQAEDRNFGLVVEGIHDTEEIVVKPLSKMLKGITAFAGATIMGDGRVALILDVLGIAQRANVVSESHERSTRRVNENETRNIARQTLLLFVAAENRRMAIPLSSVARLEEFSVSEIERAGDHEVVQYRNQILPLIKLSKFFGRNGQPDPETDRCQVVVYTEQGRSVGFVVDRILDIVEEAVTTTCRSTQRGVRSSAVVQGKVTDIVDVHALISSFDPEFFDAPVEMGAQME